MVQTISELDRAELLERIVAFYTYFNENNDVISAKKVKQLGQKLNDGEFAICFCGHFSAGKSSMINRIIGENLLPSSPIPTSANLVKIKIGEEYAKVFFKKGNPKLYPAPYDFAKVKSFCKDGDQIQAIEISHASEILPMETVILDTPGIDSTDDAHRIATESALHLADLVFYVMDYNHVQSELNFLFTKELTRVGKEVYLVINQVDKHREEELSFADFQRSVEDSFASWGVKPASIFYTTLKEPNHPLNQFAELTLFIHESIAKRKELLPKSVYYSLKKVSDEHLSSQAECHFNEVERIEELLSTSEINQESIRKSYQEYQEELEAVQQSLSEKENGLREEIEKILNNAYLMPFQTRELAEKYLVAVQPDFKVGLFFSKQKTETERQERLQAFYEDFQDKVKTQIEWHLKDLLNRVLKNDHIQDAALLSAVQSFELTFSKELLSQNVKTGAKVSGEYVLNYTRDVVEAIKKVARTKVDLWKEKYIEIISRKLEERKQFLSNEITRLNRFVEALREKEEIEDSNTAIKIKLEQLLSGPIVLKPDEVLMNQMLAETEKVEVISLSLEDEGMADQVDSPSWKSREKRVSGINDHVKVQKESESIVNQLRITAQELSNLPGFKKKRKELLQKAERLESKSFTVALFGAFSAGKSSFANALIGEKLLPVSPNPTTAAINKILPVDDSHPHGTVIVKFKSEEVLFEDVNRSLAVFQKKASNFDQAMALIEKIIQTHLEYDANEKTHYAFLSAFYKGFSTYQTKLGDMLETGLTEFGDFVAKEEKSCLVEEIKVYFDCELTQKGITLVDTPGADSINARHTGVAFEYIKNSDAILFVTYYNHAFSRADREFLIQLGRVKDTFEMDKMFFIINAKDLAHDEEEMHAVLDYVADQLIQYGIRAPHLFPISSLLAIQEKKGKLQGNDSGIAEFEDQFYSFIQQELMYVAIKAAKTSGQRAVHQLNSYILSAREDKGVKHKRIERLNLEQEQLTKIMNCLSLEVLNQRLAQEIGELVYYIKQRVFFRFHDFFKESFNPTVLKDDGRNLKKALNNALEDLLDHFGYEFAQELRATGLRIESYMNKLMKETHHSFCLEALKVNDELIFREFEPFPFENLEYESAFVELERQQFKKALAYFKNPKSFFEKNEKKYCSEEIEKQLEEPADQYLMSEKNRATKHYQIELDQVLQQSLCDYQEQSNEFYQGMIATLSDEISIDQLERIASNIPHFS